MSDALERIYYDPRDGYISGKIPTDHPAFAHCVGYIRADRSPSPEVVKELVEALREAHEALLWCARDGRMASPLLPQYCAKWAAEVGAKLAKLEAKV